MTKNTKILNLYKSGISVIGIAGLFDLSRQRIYQIVNKHYKKSVSGNTSYNDFIKEKVLRRDHYKCQWGKVCKGEYNKIEKYKRLKLLHVHHIDGNYTNNKLSNLITLCRFCHYKTWKRRNIKGYHLEKINQ